MGILDFLGGQAKVAPVPPEIRELAKYNQGISKSLYDIFGTSINDAKDYAPGIQRLLNQGSRSLNGAYDFANRHARDSRRTYGDLYKPGIEQTGDEILRAGDQDRQDYEATRARDDINSESQGYLGQLERMRRRSGYGGGLPTASELLGIASNQAGAANSARYRERERGEAIRRQFFPTFINQGDATLQRQQNPAGIKQLQSVFKSGAATALPGLVNNGASQVGRSSGAHSELASSQFGNLWAANNFRTQANTKRKNNILESVFNVAGAAAGAPGIGSSARGGFAGGGFSGGLGGFGGGNFGFGDIAGNIFGGRHPAFNSGAIPGLYGPTP